MNAGPQAAQSRWCKGSLGMLAWAPDCSKLAVASSYGTYILDPSTLSERQVIEAPTYITALVYSLDGRLLAQGNAASNTIELRDAVSGTIRSLLSGHTGWITGLAFSPDGERLASVSVDNGLRLWKVSDGSLLFRLSGSTRELKSVAFTPDGGAI